MADLVDRRRMLLFTQSWMLLAAAVLGALTLAGDATVLGRSASSGAALIVERVTDSSLTIRCGYDLFSEVEFLLSAGQPRESADTPTLDLHIALMRRWIVKAGIPLWEIPPVPPGHQFLACLDRVCRHRAAPHRASRHQRILHIMPAPRRRARKR